MRVLKVHNEYCPICEYELQHCQCIFGGKAHPNRDRRIRIVKDHLEMLSPKQVGHLIALEDWWQTSYGDEEDAEEFERFKAFIKEKGELQTDCIECPDIGEYPECYDRTKCKECPRRKGE